MGNELILSNLSHLLYNNVALWVRIPVVPSVNDKDEDMKMISAFFEEHGYPKKVELLPYHSLGKHKYQALGRSHREFDPPSKERIEELKRFFK